MNQTTLRDISKVVLTGLVSDAYWLTRLLLAWSKSFENVPVKPWQYQDTVRALQSNDRLFLSLRCAKSNQSTPREPFIIRFKFS